LISEYESATAPPVAGGAVSLLGGCVQAERRGADSHLFRDFARLFAAMIRSLACVFLAISFFTARESRAVMQRWSGFVKGI